MSERLYRKTDQSPRSLTPGWVWHWDEGERGAACQFRCPCGERSVYVTSPPHGISFDTEGLLTLKGSVGYAARDSHPENWCHFKMEAGVATMYGDAQCPGAKKA